MAEAPANARRELEMTSKLVVLSELHAMDHVWSRHDMRALSSRFRRDGWVVLRNCIPAVIHGELVNYASEILGDGAAKVDSNYYRAGGGRIMAKSDRASRMCARLLTGGVREIVQHNLTPSHFTLLLEYRTDGCVLRPHFDSSPITLSICLDTNGCWPLQAGTCFCIATATSHHNRFRVTQNN